MSSNANPPRADSFIRYPWIFLLTICHFVCPLLFFTDLTRNPYFFQITLLNASICLIVVLSAVRALKNRRWEFSKSALDFPWAVWLGICLASILCSYFGHASFFRPAILNESFRIMFFTVVNCFFVYWISKNIPASSDPADVPVSSWSLLFIIWVLLWALYPALKGTTAAGAGIWSHAWNSYGGMLWLAGLGTAFWLVRGGRQEDFWHLAFIAGAIAAGYGILQYFRIEWIWPKLLNPYGNRSVSTFGNPNFISSYLVILIPLVAAYFLNAKTLARRLFYGFIFLLYAVLLISSLTRSSWVGAVVALSFLFVFKEYRMKIAANKRLFICLACFMVLIVFLWPDSSRKGYRPIVVKRLTAEFSHISISKPFAPPEKIGRQSGPWHQRLLIWGCCWQMGLENPAFGKGWGGLELFYPYYQGALMRGIKGFRGLRTHANNAHNEIIEIWAQTGLLGLGAYIWFFATLFLWFLKFYKTAGENDRYWAVPLAAGTAGMLTDNMLNVSMHFAVPGFIFWWQIGSLSSRLARGSPGRVLSWRAKPWFHRGVAVVLVILGIAGVYLWNAQFMREIHYFRGFKHMRRNDFSKAVRELESAHGWHPREVNSNYELGNAYARMEHFSRARWAYGEALKSNCGYDEIFFNAAIILGRKLNNWDDAEKYLETSLFINPLNALTYTSLAEIFIKYPKRYAKKGIQLMNQALEMFPSQVNYYNTLGYFYTVGGDFQKARQAYSDGLKIDPDNPMLRANFQRSLGHPPSHINKYITP